MKTKAFAAALILALLWVPALAEINLDSRASFNMGYTYLQDKQYYAAIENFKTSIKDPSYPLLDYSYFYIAECYFNKKHYPEAAQVYKEVSDHFKDSVLVPKALFGLAKSQAAQDDYKTATQTLRALIAQYPNNEVVPEARYRLGQYLEKLKKYEEASRVFRNLNLIHANSYFAEKALDQLDKLAKTSALAHYKAPAASVYNLGIKYFKVRNYTKAKEYFSRITKYYKRSSYYDEANLMLGRVCLRKGKTKTAEKYFKRAINQGKDAKPEAMYYLARTYSYRDKLKAAIPLLQKVVDRYPNHYIADDSLYYIGYYNKLLGNTAEAVVAFDKLINKYPNSDLYLSCIWFAGNNFYKQKDYQAAYKVFSRAIYLPPHQDSDRLMFWAGKSAEKIGNKDKAIEAFKLTIARHDHSYYGYRAREELEKYNINIKPSAIPEVADIEIEINGDTGLTASHEAKYKELMVLKMADQAAEEAEYLVKVLPPDKKEKANIAKYHAYVMKGKFAKPIYYADKKINEANLSGNLADVNPRLWRFSYPRGYWQYVNKFAKKYDVDPHLVYAVIREESRFKSRALSRSWAHGLMQVIPSTGRILSRKLGIKYSRWKMYQPRVNIEMGTYYLAQLVKRFDGNVHLALAGYNGGPVRVKRWKKKYKDFDLDEFIEDIPLYETRNYVKKVMKSFYGYKRVYSGS